MYVAVVLNIILCFSVAPYSVVIMGNTSYSQGEQLQLRCSSEGGPQLEYTWIFSDSLITIATSNILTIDNVTTSNGGDYTCNVTNNAGYDTSTVTVYSELLLRQLNFICIAIHVCSP